MRCVYIHVYVIYRFPIHTLHISIGSLEASVNAAAMVLNTTHFLLTWSPPGDAINPALLNYIVVVRNGSAAQTQFATSVNETRAIVLLTLLSKCDTNFIIQPMCSTTAGSKTTGIQQVLVYIHACNACKQCTHLSLSIYIYILYVV